MSPGSASESLSPGPASESLVVAAPTELAPPGPHANPAAPAQDARYFLRNADGSMMTEEEAAPMAATMAAQDLAQERDRLQRAQEIERLVMEARGLRPPANEHGHPPANLAASQADRERGTIFQT